MENMFERNCPECNKIIYHKSKYSRNASVKKKCLCTECCNTKFNPKNEDRFRNCPKCFVRIEYPQKFFRDLADKEETLCKKCSYVKSKETLSKKIKINNEKFINETNLEAICPKCNKIRKFKTIKDYKDGIKRTCPSCSKKVDHGDLIRNCPSCNIELKYNSYTHFNRAKSENSKCRKCGILYSHRKFKIKLCELYNTNIFEPLLKRICPKCNLFTNHKNEADCLVAAKNNLICGSCRYEDLGKIKMVSKLEIKHIDIFNKYGFLHSSQYNGNIINLTPDYKKDKTIIEIYGDFWHRNPKNKLYGDPDFIDNKIKIKSSYIWERDQKRISRLNKAGYKVYVIWELDLKNKYFDLEKYLQNIIITGNNDSCSHAE